MKIKKTLDDSLKEARDRAAIKELGSAFNAVIVGDSKYNLPINIAISGPTGVGKTSIITEWGEEHSEELNFYTIDATLLNVSDIDGDPVIFSTDEIENMAKPDTVLYY